jgi:predicted dehydrogenase
MKPIEFGIVGAGWRTEFYLRIARALPERFRTTGVVVRNPEKRKPFEQAWGVRVCADADELLKTSPLFVVTAVSWAGNPELLKHLSERGIPVLSETPPAPDLPQLAEVSALAGKGAKIQVAEQYWAQPHHQACSAVIEKGLIGRPTHAQISVAHGYHGISLIRRFLGIGFEPPKISGKRLVAPIVAGGGRNGPPTEEKTRNSDQDIVFLDWGDRLGILDFTGDQYFGWIRNPRVLIRGERGEIVNDTVYYLKDFRTPMAVSLRRDITGANGNLEGFYLRGIQAGSEWAYANPFAPAPLSDDEIAIATCLAKMDEYVRTGREFYTLAEACQDHYLNLVYQQALKEGREISPEPQEWAD